MSLAVIVFTAPSTKHKRRSNLLQDDPQIFPRFFSVVVIESSWLVILLNASPRFKFDKQNTEQEVSPSDGHGNFDLVTTD